MKLKHKEQCALCDVDGKRAPDVPKPLLRRLARLGLIEHASIGWIVTPMGHEILDAIVRPKA